MGIFKSRIINVGQCVMTERIRQEEMTIMNLHMLNSVTLKHR
jgi:hypothetical protein